LSATSRERTPASGRGAEDSRSAGRPGLRQPDQGPFRLWLTAARPRTLPAAVAPVVVGTALAGSEGVFRPLAFLAALVGSVFIQIGTNLSNDYSDARRGADTEDRLGPVRVTAGGLVPPRRVLLWTYLAFGVALVAGAYLTVVAGIELLLVGIVSILAGVLYTGGPRPYGYEGLGELFVFLFFGVVAVCGSYFVQTERLTGEALAVSVPVGLLAAGILVVNNIRDVDTDRRAGKRTLVVKLGRERARYLFAGMVGLALASPVAICLAFGLDAWVLLPIASTPLAVGLARTVGSRTDGPALNSALAGAGALLGVFSVLLAAGLLLS
jgi:1,4-dihydroxy-2-naphthoate octaprenyltransferase